MADFDIRVVSRRAGGLLMDGQRADVARRPKIVTDLRQVESWLSPGSSRDVSRRQPLVRQVWRGRRVVIFGLSRG